MSINLVSEVVMTVMLIVLFYPIFLIPFLE